ncbi:hypothetical protein F2Q68_00029539 [Brassica cretica]|uniref:Uncharacterized protein n=1 Tax=Brassica cretica TaxID=69181 RepID=A0A8S9G5F6_BRACR|nr:hypothetical protein F2Q68_00029539 [Brassica cretica]
MAAEKRRHQESYGLDAINGSGSVATLETRRALQRSLRGVEDKQDGGVGFLNPVIGGLEARMRSRRGSMETLREKSSAMDSGGDISGAFSSNTSLASSDDGERSRNWWHVCLAVECRIEPVLSFVVTVLGLGLLGP